MYLELVSLTALGVLTVMFLRLYAVNSQGSEGQ